MWRDELEPWLTSSFSSDLGDFFVKMKMISNPYAWYLYLFLLSRLTLNPVFLQISHILIACGSIYLFLKYSPFTLLQKLLFCCGYYLVYDYGIISRGYAVTLFFFFLFCVMYKKSKTNFLPLALPVFFMANSTGGFGAVLAIALLVFLLADFYFNERPVQPSKNLLLHRAGAVLIIVVSVVVAVKSIWPPPESVYSASNWYTGFNTNRFVSVVSRIWSGFLPVPVLSGVQFWNTNILNHAGNSGLEKGIVFFGSLLILVLTSLVFIRNKAVLLLYLAGLSGILLFSYTSTVIFRINAARYNGFMYILFFVCLWLKDSFPVTRPKASGSSQNLLILFFLLINLFSSVVAYSKELSYTFSAAKETGQFILKNNLQRLPAAAIVDYAVAPVCAYTRSPFYFPERDSSSTYPLWLGATYSSDQNVVMGRLLNRISQSRDTYLLVFNFDLKASLLKDIEIKAIKEFKGCIVQDENYSLYLAYPYDPLKELFSTSALTDEKARRCVAMAGELLKLGRQKECDRIVERIKLKTYANRDKDFHREIAFNGIAGFYMEDQSGDSAIAYFEKSLAVSPGNADALGNLGMCYLNFKKDLGRAEQCWDELIRLNPGNLQVYYNLLGLCQHINDKKGERKYLHLLLNKGVSVDEIRKHGFAVSPELLP